ncbi:spermatogenesis-associated protein 7 homolog isoform X2 [Xenopus laevis]|uniref:Spermatogenesis-associated protein 7 homolog isoform X2 n=1 Tax=Xenopus laevis TaxID=8355 RepID=A0A8J0TI12_XENLA|nr:spermatogenesis-associated protein 7 homolog isoform X2 [Xenopus laevis]
MDYKRYTDGAPSIPRCGISSPFKGHLSTKSNAFSTGSSSWLSEQYRIRNHMVAHYNKILAAKAAIDCSVPKSMQKSIKYSDQQRREKMRKEVARFEKNISRPTSCESADSILFSKKDIYDDISVRHSTYSDRGQIFCSSPSMSSPRPFGFLGTSEATGRSLSRKCAGPRVLSRVQNRGSNSSSIISVPRSYSKFQDNQQKTYSGDLLDKHSEQFTGKTRPFTPRTLKTEAKSALASYRYYTPPRRKKREMVKDLQRDLNRSPMDEDVTWEKKNKELTEDTLFNEDKKEPLKNEECNQIRPWSQTDWEEQANTHGSRLLYNEVESCSPVMQKIQSEEEELFYLKFVTDITNEILNLGLFSNRVLERVFKRHLEENRHCLDEAKMCYLLDNLRKDLGCNDTNHSTEFRTSVDKPSRTVNHSRDMDHFLQDMACNEESQEHSELFLYERDAETFRMERKADTPLHYHGLLTSEITTDFGSFPTDDSENEQNASLLETLSTSADLNKGVGDPEEEDQSISIDDLQQRFSETVIITEAESPLPDEAANSPASGLGTLEQNE